MMMAPFSHLHLVLMVAVLLSVLDKAHSLLRFISNGTQSVNQIGLPMSMSSYCLAQPCEFQMALHRTNDTLACVTIKNVDPNKMSVKMSSTRCGDDREQWIISHIWPSTVEGTSPVLFLSSDEETLYVSLNQNQRYTLKVYLGKQATVMSLVDFKGDPMVEVINTSYPCDDCVILNDGQSNWWGTTIVADDTISLKPYDANTPISLMAARLEMKDELCNGTDYFVGTIDATVNKGNWMELKLKNTDDISQNVTVDVENMTIITLPTLNDSCPALYEMYHLFVKNALISLNCLHMSPKKPKPSMCLSATSNQVPLILFLVIQFVIFSGYTWIIIDIRRNFRVVPARRPRIALPLSTLYDVPTTI